MNYYERHLGDYARDTAHLSMLEHGAYGLLMDRYYATEQGIPADQAHRLCRARSREEKAAVDAVLAEFFALQDGVWLQGRIEGEIEKTQGRIAAARGNGKRGGRPKKETQKKPTGLLLGSENETQTKAPQTPPIQTTEPDGSGAEAPIEPADPIWGTGLAFLIRKGIPEKQARALLGKIKHGCGDMAAATILADAEAQDITNPAPWLLQAASSAQRTGGSHASPVRLSAAERVLAHAVEGERADRERAEAGSHGRPYLVGANG